MPFTEAHTYSIGQLVEKLRDTTFPSLWRLRDPDRCCDVCNPTYCFGLEAQLIVARERVEATRLGLCLDCVRYGREWKAKGNKCRMDHYGYLGIGCIAGTML